MRQRWFVRAALAAVVGLGVAASLSRAQGPASEPPPTEPWAVIEFGAGSPPAPQGAADPSVPPGKGPLRDWFHGSLHRNGAGADSSPEQAAAADPTVPPSKGPIRDCVHGWMHRKGMGCWSHNNAYLCGSWKSECIFVFGSCREFFGEPCLPGPPQPLMPPGYGPPPSYLPQPGFGPQAGPGQQAGYDARLWSPGYGKGGCPGCQ
jgi:hypothetical protein